MLERGITVTEASVLANGRQMDEDRPTPKGEEAYNTTDTNTHIMMLNKF